MRTECKVENGLCMTHGYSISENVICPDFPNPMAFREYNWRLTYHSRRVC